jgi:hypothetical protein
MSYIEPSRNTTTEDTTRNYSPAIWSDCPIEDIRQNPNLGWYVEDDFMSAGYHIGIASHLTKSCGPYTSYADAGVILTGSSDEHGGALAISGNDADNDEGHLGGAGGFVISDTASEASKLWFEARFKKVTAVGDDGLAIFVGLGSTAAIAANGLVDDTGALLATGAFVGFRTLHADGDALQFTYQAASQTVQNKIAALDTLVADTYVKCGFVYDPDADAAERIKVYLNGVANSTMVTGTNIAAAEFPDSEEMGICLLTKVGAAVEQVFEMDWWRCYQRAPA